MANCYGFNVSTLSRAKSKLRNLFTVGSHDLKAPESVLRPFTLILKPAQKHWYAILDTGGRSIRLPPEPVITMSSGSLAVRGLHSHTSRARNGRSPCRRTHRRPASPHKSWRNMSWVEWRM